MKKKNIMIVALLFSVFATMSFIYSGDANYYYAYGEKIHLDESDNKLMIKFKQNKKSDINKTSLNTKLVEKKIEWENDSICIITFNQSEKQQFRNLILKQEDVVSCNPVYIINTGLEMGITDEFLVKFNENVSISEIENIKERYGVEAVKTTDIYIKFKVPYGADVLEISNRFQESGLTRFSHPNFFTKLEFHQVIPNDQYFVNQFSLNNTGQVFTDGHSGSFDADIDAPEAWSFTKGNANIIIAVLDQGLTSDHPDLPNTRQVRLNGSNFGDGDPNDPSPTSNNNHGNACAGIIGATQNNNIGISGVAPNCKIMPIRIFSTKGTTAVTVESTADAIDFARENGADVISNSWSYNSNNPNQFPVIKDAIILATTMGRNLLGCVVTFSAGNTANLVENRNGFVRFPGNVEVAGVLTVGASDRYDMQANYSPKSDPESSNNQIIDLVAPSHRAYSSQISTETFEAWSIDIPGEPGYNPVHNTDGGSLPTIGSELPGSSGIITRDPLHSSNNNHLSYTGRFGGTSYASPQVAGVAALLLSINPNLTQQQIFDILTTTCDKVGGYTYSDGRSDELGFGRLNALNSILQVLSINGNTFVCESEPYSVTNLPPDATVVWSIPNPGPPMPQLLQNTPNINECTIINPYNYPLTITLTAVINLGSGDPIILNKTIISEGSNSQIQSGSYYQEACYFYNVYHPSQSGSLPATLNTPVFLHQGCMTQISLNQMEGRTVSSTDGEPLFWDYQSDNSMLFLQLPLGSGGIPFTFKITGDGACYEKSLLFFSYSNNTRYAFAIAPNPVIDVLTIYSNPNDEVISQKGNEEVWDEMEYEVFIFDVTSNVLLHHEKSVKGEKEHLINVLKLRKGYHVLKIIEGDEIHTIKFLKK